MTKERAVFIYFMTILTFTCLKANSQTCEVLNPEALFKRRFGSHSRKAEGYGNLVIDRVAQGPIGRAAIRGREQQLIDYYGGVGSPNVGNSIRGVARYNPQGRFFHAVSNKKFGPLAPYTGW